MSSDSALPVALYFQKRIYDQTSSVNISLAHTAYYCMENLLVLSANLLYVCVFCVAVGLASFVQLLLQLWPVCIFHCFNCWSNRQKALICTALLLYYEDHPLTLIEDVIYQRWWLPSPLPAVALSPRAGSPALSGVSSAAHLSPSDGTPPWQRSPVRRWPVGQENAKNCEFRAHRDTGQKVLLKLSRKNPWALRC